jgi:hypothetical protein
MSRTVKMIGLSVTALFLLLILTDPRELPSVMLITPFLLLFMILASGISLLLRYYGITAAKRLRMAMVVATFPVLLLVLQSLGQLTIRDTLAIVALFGIAYFYLSRFGVQATR